MLAMARMGVARSGPEFKAMLGRLFGIDRRALAVLRIALGALVLADLAKRARLLEAHYSDAGVLPREAARRLTPDRSIFELYFLSGDAREIAKLFLVIHLLFAIAFIAAARRRT